MVQYLVPSLTHRLIHRSKSDIKRLPVVWEFVFRWISNLASSLTVDIYIAHYHFLIKIWIVHFLKDMKSILVISVFVLVANAAVVPEPILEEWESFKVS